MDKLTENVYVVIDSHGRVVREWNGQEWIHSAEIVAEEDANFLADCGIAPLEQPNLPKRARLDLLTHLTLQRLVQEFSRPQGE